MKRLAVFFGFALFLLLPTSLSATECQFVLGFATLRDLIGHDIVGDCLENQRFAANGNAEQQTTGGLLVWRKADNWTAFTDGYRTWLSGPNGLEQRLNTERFAWEPDYAPGGGIATPEPIFSHNVMVRVVRVTPDWHGYDTNGGWLSAVRVRESDALKFFEVAIWEETKSIHFYEFDNDFDPIPHGLTPQQLTSIRETYAIMRFDGMPDPWTEARSQFIRQAFTDFTAYLAGRYPDSDHHLMYHGHGGPGGQLFAGLLSYGDADGLLRSWTQALGRPLGVIDMGGPCNKGSLSDLENFCQHTRYYVASDLPNGGYTMDEWSIEKYHEASPETQYHSLFSSSESLEDALIGRIDLKRKRYEYSRNNMIENQVEQANYLYSCQEFADFRSAFRQFLSSQDGQYSVFDDLYDYMVSHDADDDLKRLFDNVFVHRADNRDFFQWQLTAGGMLMPIRE